ELGGSTGGLAREVGHAHPEIASGVRLVAGLGHEDQPQMVGLGLLSAAPRQQHADRSARAQERTHALRDGGIAGGRPRQRPDHRIDSHLVAHALAPVPRHHVAISWPRSRPWSPEGCQYRRRPCPRGRAKAFTCLSSWINRYSHWYSGWPLTAAIRLPTRV